MPFFHPNSRFLLKKFWYFVKMPLFCNLNTNVEKVGYMESLSKDAIFLEALSDGNEKAFDALFVEYYPKVLSFVLRFCFNEFEAEDIVQRLFMDLWVKRERLSYISNLDNYLFVSARNASLKYVRESLRYKDVETADMVTDNLSGEVLICYEELEQILMREIEKMPEQRRRIFLMSRMEGLSNGEIAEKLHISKRTVESHISLALAYLREIMPIFVILTLLNKK